VLPYLTLEAVSCLIEQKLETDERRKAETAFEIILRERR